MFFDRLPKSMETWKMQTLKKPMRKPVFKRKAHKENEEQKRQQLVKKQNQLNQLERKQKRMLLKTMHQ